MAKDKGVSSRVISRIYGWGRGYVFTPRSFLDLGTRGAIDVALKRLVASGVIRHLARGLYDYPLTHPVMGKLAPSIEAIAKALADRDVVKLQPSGAYAANLLGLSQQVPARVVFLTDGSPRTIRLGNREIVLQRTTPRFMETAGRISGLVIQALRYIGKDAVTIEVVDHLRSALSVEDRHRLVTDAPLAPAWIADIMREIGAEESQRG